MNNTLHNKLLTGGNSFDALRFVAASLVIISHSFALAGWHEPHLGSVTIGLVGVATFFVMSGFLIANSWHTHPRVGAFLGKRLLRIIPALAVVIFLSAFVLGPFMSTLSGSEYLRDQKTIQYLSGVSIFNIQSTLPGVFNANPLPSAVNGSLWTLPYEFMAYILIAFLGLFGLFNKNSRVFILMFFMLVGSNIYFNKYWPVSDYLLPPFGLSIKLTTFLLAFFMIGVIYFKYSRTIRLSGAAAVVCVLVITLSSLSGRASSLILFFFLPYLVFYLASQNIFGSYNFGKFGDFSYGLYIYAFPVQQTVVQLSHSTITPLRLCLISYILTLLLAIASWKVIEKPALKYKKHFSKDRYPLSNKYNTDI